MLRLHRIKISATDQKQIQPLQQALQLIKKHAASSTLYFFAQPALDQNSLDWLSYYSGTIQPYSSLSSSQQEQLLNEANQHLATVKHLHTTLSQQGHTQAAEQLLPLLQPLNKNYLYAVDNKAVYTPSLQASAPLAVPAPTATPVPPPMATAAAAAPFASTTTANRRGWLWAVLLVLLLLLLLAALAWWWLTKNKEARPISKETTPVIEEVTETGEGKNNPFGTKFACQTEAIEPPEFTLIFDTSGSMNLNIHTTLAEEEWYYSSSHYRTEPELHAIELRLEQEPKRISVAKEAMKNMLGALHTNVSTQLYSFETCGHVVNHGRYSSQRRTDLLNTVQQLEPQGGTPSALALWQAAQNMDGIDKDGMIVLVIDGEDGCGDNICEVAQHIAQNQPRIHVNVVDITGFGLSNCVATQTGGRVYSSNNINEINTMMRDSIEEVAIDPNCHD